jgi:phosphonate transport system ATP-binding protein
VNYSVHKVAKQFVVNHKMVSALESISLSIADGEQLAVLGSSGAGKTTLFRILNATLRPSSGFLHVDGRELSAMSSRDLRHTRRRIGTIYQHHNLVPSLTALQNTLCGGLGRWSLSHTIRNIFNPAKADAEQAMHSLELVGLAEKRYARADELSGGQQQRLAVARVLMQEPHVILADEPVASLDPALAEEIVSLIIRVGSEGNRTLVMALHKVELAVHHFPRVVGLRAGSVCFDQPSFNVDDELLRHLYRYRSPEAWRIGNEYRHQRELGCTR